MTLANLWTRRSAIKAAAGTAAFASVATARADVRNPAAAPTPAGAAYPDMLVLFQVVGALESTGAFDAVRTEVNVHTSGRAAVVEPVGFEVVQRGEPGRRVRKVSYRLTLSIATPGLLPAERHAELHGLLCVAAEAVDNLPTPCPGMVSDGRLCVTSGTFVEPGGARRGGDQGDGRFLALGVRSLPPTRPRRPGRLGRGVSLPG